MSQAGLSIHQQRICEPYGPDQRKGLWLFHVIEPDTWAKVVARVNGANQGALYAKENGNILGRLKVTRPEGKTWKEFVQILLETMPPILSEHYRNKIAVFLRWYQTRGYPEDILDEAPGDLSANYQVPSWRRVCKMLLRNDYWCRDLNFSQTKSHALQAYQERMAKRRNEWDLPGFISVGGHK
jgi:predicted phosphoadenosine phosphosulfate sulfurtransferase